MILTTLLKTKGNLPVFPTEEHCHLKSGHLQIILSSPVREHQRSTRAQQGDELVGESDGAIGHVVMPLQLPATMLRLVELLHLRVEDVNSWTKFQMCHWRNNMIAGLTSGIKSSSSLGKVTGTLSLVLAQAPTLRIFIDTCNEDFKHHTLTAEATLHLAPPVTFSLF